MGLAVTLSLVFLWVCLFHFGYSFKSIGKAFATLMVSKPKRTYVLLIYVASV